MIIEIPESLQNRGYLEGWDLIFWIVYIILSVIGILYLIRRSIKSRILAQKRFYLYFSLFFLGYGLTRIFFILAVAFPISYDIFVLIGYLMSFIGIFFIMLGFEKYIIPTKGILSILSLITVAFISVAILVGSSKYIVLNLIYILGPLFIGSLFIIYIYLIRKTAGEMKRKTIEGFIGMSFY